MGDFRHYPTNSGLPTKLFKVNYPYSPKKNMVSDPVNTIFHYPWGTTSNSITEWDILWSGAEWRNRSARLTNIRLRDSLTLLKAPVVSLRKTLYTHCFILVGSWNRMLAWH